MFYSYAKGIGNDIIEICLMEKGENISRLTIDKIKENYCKENNIGFLAIPRWWIQNKHDVKRYKQEIDNIIGRD